MARGIISPPLSADMHDAKPDIKPSTREEPQNIESAVTIEDIKPPIGKEEAEDFKQETLGTSRLRPRKTRSSIAEKPRTSKLTARKRRTLKGKAKEEP